MTCEPYMFVLILSAGILVGLAIGLGINPYRIKGALKHLKKKE